ncbi:MAG TPA: GGDEF domain-containing protein [Candidatus Sulfotelmatobacter sp.]|jgi:diguanylate cyclase (GGDEF)-like protein|nr:GGDEF domain-containing protein [Candidatus Sulfotelmatobacter sp.]
MTASFVTETASSQQKIVISAFAGVLVTMAGVSMLQAGMPLLQIPAFLPFYGALVIVTDSLTAYLLAVQFHITRKPSTLMLSAAYLYSGLIVIPHLLVFPGVVTATGLWSAGPQSAVWMWVLWHGGFPLLVCGYAFLRRLENSLGLDICAPCWSFLMPAMVIAAVAGLALLVTVGRDLLPELVEGNDFSRLSQSVFAKGVIALNLLALIGVVAVSRCRAVGDLGLALAMLASLLDVTLTLHSGARFSLGWYMARLNSVVSASTVLSVYLYEVGWLHHKVASLNVSLLRMAFLDQLTGLANRRQFDQRLDAEWGRAAREGHPLSLAMLDVDFFKKYNDRYGHVAGDDCLSRVAQAIAGALKRPGDLAARYGGEEFALILPDTGENGAEKMAKAVVEAVRHLHLRHESGVDGGIVTVSVGVATIYPSAGRGYESLKETADRALYQAKESGRNRVSAVSA